MPQKPKENPIALLKFFSQLDPGGAAEDECQLHYGCSCVLRKGLEAAQMLVDIQEFLGIKPGAVQDEKKSPAAAQPAPAPAADSGDDMNAEMLEEAQGEIDRLLTQNMGLASENKSLKEKLALLQRQVERLYAKNEMMTTLSRLETKKMTDVEMAGEEPKPAAAPETPEPPQEKVEEPVAQAEEPAPDVEEFAAEQKAEEPAPAQTADEEPKGTNKELQDALFMEAVARVPKEQQEAEKEAAAASVETPAS